MIRLTTALLFSTLAWNAFAQGMDYQKRTETLERVSGTILANVNADGSLPASTSLDLSDANGPLFDVSVLVAARPQSFAPEDFQPLIKLGETANKVTQIYVNGGTSPAGGYALVQNQEKYQDDISRSAVFSIHALGNVAQGLSAFIAQLPAEKQQEPSRLQGKVIMNSSIFQQFAAISGMAVVDGMSAENRIAMIDALAGNLPLFSTIITDATLGDIYSNFRIRLFQLPNGSPVKEKLAALQQQVADLQADKSRVEILTN